MLSKTIGIGIDAKIIQLGMTPLHRLIIETLPVKPCDVTLTIEQLDELYFLIGAYIQDHKTAKDK